MLQVLCVKIPSQAIFCHRLCLLVLFLLMCSVCSYEYQVSFRMLSRNFHISLKTCHLRQCDLTPVYDALLPQIPLGKNVTCIGSKLIL